MRVKVEPRLRLRILMVGVIVSAIALLAVAAVAAMNVVVIVRGQAGIVASTGDVADCPAAIVLGARVYQDGTPCPVLKDRLDTALELYRSGRVRKLLLTGDHGTRAYDEVNGMRRYALAGGAAPQDLFMDHAGFDTYDSMYRTKAVFRVRKAVVISQGFHLARAVCIARDVGIEAQGLRADRRVYSGRWGFEAREVLARVKAFVQVYLTRPLPRFLGPAVPITGDGRATWDEDVLPGGP